MRLGIVVIALWPYLGLWSVADEDKATAPPQERLVGGWVNIDKDTRGLKRLAVAKKDDTWSIAAWGSSGGGKGESPWGETGLALLGDSVASKYLPYGFATWTPGFAVVHLTLRLEKDELVVETFMLFKDNSGRSDYRSVYRFRKN